MLIKTTPDPTRIPVKLKISFSTPRGMNRIVARMQVPAQMEKVAKHLKSEGYEWMGMLGYGKRWSRIEFSGPYELIEAGLNDAVEGGVNRPEADRVQWRISAFYLHRVQAFVHDEDEIDAYKQSVLRRYDELDGLAGLP